MLKKLITASIYSDVNVDLVKTYQNYNLYSLVDKTRPNDSAYLEFIDGYIVQLCCLSDIENESKLTKIQNTNYIEFFSQMFTNAYEKGTTIPIGYCQFLIDTNRLEADMLDKSIKKNEELKLKRLEEKEALRAAKELGKKILEEKKSKYILEQSLLFKKGRFVSNKAFLDLCKDRNISLPPQLRQWLMRDVVEISKSSLKAKTLNQNIGKYMGNLYEIL